MFNTFDPYGEWLKIPPERRPPTYHDLLGLPPTEYDVARIHAAAEEKIEYLRSLQMGPQRDLVLRLIGEVSKADACLADEAVKRTRHEQLATVQVERQTLTASPAKTAIWPLPIAPVLAEAAATTSGPRIPVAVPQSANVASLRPRNRKSLNGVLAGIGAGFAIGIVVVWALGRSSGSTAIQAPSFVATPQLQAIADPIVDEGTLLNLAIGLSPDLPAGVGAEGILELVGQRPAGLSFDPAHRRLTWAPSEGQGPGEFHFTLRLRRDLWQTTDDVRSFKIVVREVNQPPTISEIPRQTATHGTMFTYQVKSTDPDVPANPLHYELLDAPIDARIDQSTGAITWTPNANLTGTARQSLHIRVSDDAKPPGQAEAVMLVDVRPVAAPAHVAGLAAPAATADWINAETMGPKPVLGLPNNGPASNAPAVDLTVQAPNLALAPKLYENEFQVDDDFFRRSSSLWESSYRNGCIALARDPNRAGAIITTISSSQLSSIALNEFACEVAVRFVAGSFVEYGLYFGSSSQKFSITMPQRRCALCGNGRRLPDDMGQPAGQFDRMLFVVRNRQAMGYLNGIRVAGPMPIDASLTLPGRVGLVFGGSTDAECELDRVALWSLDQLPDADLRPVAARAVANLEQLTNSVGMKFARIPAGQFKIGSPANETGHRSDEEEHDVVITGDYFLGVHEVTLEQFRQVMGVNGVLSGAPAAARSRLPVAQVNFRDMSDFFQRLGALAPEKAAGRTYRLPTEAEWEYACRAGTTTPWHYGETPDEVSANFARNRGGYGSSEVGSFAPNAFGLYDMHGNVCEWCADRYINTKRFTSPLPSKDPLIKRSSPFCVVRGGGYNNRVEDCRSASRGYLRPEVRQANVGFRVVCEVEKP